MSDFETVAASAVTTIGDFNRALDQGVQDLDSLFESAAREGAELDEAIEFAFDEIERLEKEVTTAREQHRAELEAVKQQMAAVREQLERQAGVVQQTGDDLIEQVGTLREHVQAATAQLTESAAEAQNSVQHLQASCERALERAQVEFEQAERHLSEADATTVKMREAIRNDESEWRDYLSDELSPQLSQAVTTHSGTLTQLGEEHKSQVDKAHTGIADSALKSTEEARQKLANLLHELEQAGSDFFEAFEKVCSITRDLGGDVITAKVAMETGMKSGTLAIRSIFEIMEDVKSILENVLD